MTLLVRPRVKLPFSDLPTNSHSLSNKRKCNILDGFNQAMDQKSVKYDEKDWTVCGDV